MTSLEDVLLSVWRQALVEDAASVKIDNQTYPVLRWPKQDISVGKT